MQNPSPQLFSSTLINWYNSNSRSLPWRETTNPYAIWLSEIILQQTRVAQGLPYFMRFIEAFPTVQDLANAPEDEVLRLWQGLGYYSRARNLHHTAKQIVSNWDGRFPENYQDLLMLKGVGTYTAAAIASFAFKEKVAVVDGNVFRVLARVYGIDQDIATPVGKRTFQELANVVISPEHPDLHNQAIMEFGAIQCTPLQPDCLFCPLQQVCFAFNKGLVQALPVKTKAKPAKERPLHYLVLRWQDYIYMRKRGNTDIWAGLYDFYILPSSEKKLPAETVTQHLQQILPETPYHMLRRHEKPLRHILSHQKILADFYEIRLENALPGYVLEQLNLQPYSSADVEQLPKPVLISKYLKSAGF